MAHLGSDIAGVFDVDRALSTIEGRPALAQAILRRLTTPRGGLFYAPAYGYDVTSLIGASVPVSVIEQRVLEQVVAEEEVENAAVTVTYIAATSSLHIAIEVEDADGPFDLTINVGDGLPLEAFLEGTLFLGNDNASSGAA